MPPQPPRILQTSPNPTPQRDFHIHMEIPEFPCLCPKTRQPDFATLTLDSIPEKHYIDVKYLNI